jgi:hypothetical protein
MLKVLVDIPSLRSQVSGVVDIPMTIIDDDSRSVSIDRVEFVRITGSETNISNVEDGVQVTYLDTDPLQPNPLTNLATSPTGESYNIVWDSRKDLDAYVNSLLVIRVSISIGETKLGTYQSGEFSLTFKDEEAILSYNLVERGSDANLQAIFIDGTGALFNPTSVNLISLKDPDDVELLGGPQASTNVSIGVYTNAFSVTDSHNLGVYIGTFEAIFNGVTQNLLAYFQVIDNVFFAVAASSPQDTVIYGRIYNNGVAIKDAKIKFYLGEEEPGYANTINDVLEHEVLSGPSGEFSFTVQRESQITIQIDVINYVRTAKIPDVDAINFLNIEPDSPTRNHFNIPE